MCALDALSGGGFDGVFEVSGGGLLDSRRAAAVGGGGAEGRVDFEGLSSNGNSPGLNFIRRVLLSVDSFCRAVFTSAGDFILNEAGSGGTTLRPRRAGGRPDLVFGKGGGTSVGVVDSAGSASVALANGAF